MQWSESIENVSKSWSSCHHHILEIVTLAVDRIRWRMSGMLRPISCQRGSNFYPLCLQLDDLRVEKTEG
jgi:hypothetical protein